MIGMASEANNCAGNVRCRAVGLQLHRLLLMGWQLAGIGFHRPGIIVIIVVVVAAADGSSAVFVDPPSPLFRGDPAAKQQG